jgi:hypothetical protein
LCLSNLSNLSNLFSKVSGKNEAVFADALPWAPRALKTYVDFPLPSFGEKVGKIGQLGQA